MQGKILNIQRCSIHNGPGIRTTVFFKGCPMTCLEAGKIKTNLDRCSFCENCIDYCLSGSRELVGRDISARNLVDELLKDSEFFKNSNGGVTLSGGEALSQGYFTIEVAKLLKKRGISVALDTCGFVNSEQLEEISQYIDIFLYDIKIIDPEKHREFTGVDNKLIFENLQLLNHLGSRIFIRIPVIDGVNTSEGEIHGILDLIDGMDIEKISLLPYHEIGRHKYDKLDLNFKNKTMKVPGKIVIENIKKIFEKKYIVEIGG
jgi:pyruvate formate lyase activating enzyme